MAFHIKSVSGGPLVLDGGLATELEATGLKLQVSCLKKYDLYLTCDSDFGFIRCTLVQL